MWDSYVCPQAMRFMLGRVFKHLQQMWEWLGQQPLLEGPDLHTVDVEVLLGGQWLVVKSGAFGGGSSVQFSIQPQTQLPSARKEAGNSALYFVSLD